MEYKEITGTEDYRTRLDILEYYGYAINENRADTLEEMTREQLDEIAHDVADSWPNHAYRPRLIQWLQAGTPDLDDAPIVDWVQDARELIGNDNARGVTLAIHAMIGTVLYGVARAVIDDLLRDMEDGDTVREEVAREMAGCRARLRIDHGDHALTPPYQWTLAYTFDHTARVTVEARD